MSLAVNILETWKLCSIFGTEVEALPTPRESRYVGKDRVVKTQNEEYREVMEDKPKKEHI